MHEWPGNIYRGLKNITDVTFPKELVYKPSPTSIFSAGILGSYVVHDVGEKQEILSG